MKIKNLSLALITATLTSQAFAVNDPKYDKNLAMTCGKVVILTSKYTTSFQASFRKGQLVADGMDLGDVYTQVGSTRQQLSQVEKPERSIFGRKKGYGLFEDKNYKLDLRNTIDNWEVYLENKKTGEHVRCMVHGDCC